MTTRIELTIDRKIRGCEGFRDDFLAVVARRVP